MLGYLLILLFKIICRFPLKGHMSNRKDGQILQCIQLQQFWKNSSQEIIPQVNILIFNLSADNCYRKQYNSASSLILYYYNTDMKSMCAYSLVNNFRSPVKNPQLLTRWWRQWGERTLRQLLVLVCAPTILLLLTMSSDWKASVSGWGIT